MKILSAFPPSSLGLTAPLGASQQVGHSSIVLARDTESQLPQPPTGAVFQQRTHRFLQLAAAVSAGHAQHAQLGEPPGLSPAEVI